MNEIKTLQSLMQNANDSTTVQELIDFCKKYGIVFDVVIYRAHNKQYCERIRCTLESLSEQSPTSILVKHWFDPEIYEVAPKLYHQITLDELKAYIGFIVVGTTPA